jgi:palmitoyl-protein thioesterase
MLLGFFSLLGLSSALRIKHLPTIFEFPPTSPQRVANSSGVPLAIFHGLGDDCRFPGMHSFTKHFNQTLGVYTKCIEVGNGSEDTWAESMSKQAAQACAEVKADPHFANGLNVLGLSQGSLLARAVIEQCDVKVFKMSTMGGPHMGVATVPECHSGWFCNTVNFIVDLGVYSELAQSNIGPAGYYKDQYTYKLYLEKSNFLADLNNERSAKNSTYKAKFGALEGVQLIKFTEDTVVDPQESEWFGYYALDSKNLTTLNQTQLYQEDFIGLKGLYDSGKVEFVAIAAQHLQMTMAQVDEYIVPFLQS